MSHIRPVALAALIGGLVSGPATAVPDDRLIAAIEAGLAQGAGAEVLAGLAGDLGNRAAGGPGVTEKPPASPVANPEPLTVQTGMLQLALTQLTILAGSNGHLTLQRAQAGQSDALFLLNGTASLADLAAAGPIVQHEAGGWRLRRPLVIWPGATLRLSPGDVLEIDPVTGAFLLSFGSMTLEGATLRVSAGSNPVLPEFRPFVLVVGQGSIQARNSRFDGLGFAGPVAFRGISVLSAGLLKSAVPPILSGNVFHRVGALSLEGITGAVIARNRFETAGINAVSLSDVSDLALTDNRISDTAGGAGLRLTGAIDTATISGNVIEGGGRNGIQVDGAVLGLVIAANVIVGNAGAGIAIEGAACVKVTGNILARNATTGLRLRKTGAAQVIDNVILANGSAGLDVQGQTGLGPISLDGNVLRHNREGFRASGIGEVRLTANDLAAQLPRQFAGDFAPHLARYLAADAAIVIPTAHPATAPDCARE